MAKKCKQGIEYFSHDVNASQDLKLKLLMARHGIIGFGVYFILLQDIYREGYSLPLSGDYVLLFISDHKLTEDSFDNVIKDCMKFGLFDEGCYKEQLVLTSKRIQENYLEATKRRKGVVLDINTWLLSADNLPSNVSIIDKNVTIINKPVKNQESKEKTEASPKSIKEIGFRFHKNAIIHVPEYFNNIKFHAAFEEWEKMRLKKKCAVTDRRYKQVFKELDEFAGKDVELAIKILNRSSDKGYTELYALDKKQTPKPAAKNPKKHVPDTPKEIIDLRSKF